MNEVKPYEIYAGAEHDLEKRWGRGEYGIEAGYSRVCLVGSLISSSRRISTIAGRYAVTDRDQRLNERYVGELFRSLTREPSLWLNLQVWPFALLNNLGKLPHYRLSYRQAVIETWNDDAIHSKRAVIRVVHRLKEKHRGDYFELKAAELSVRIERQEQEIIRLKAQRDFWMNRWLRQNRIDQSEHELGLLWAEFDRFDAERSLNQ